MPQEHRLTHSLMKQLFVQHTSGSYPFAYHQFLPSTHDHQLYRISTKLFYWNQVKNIQFKGITFKYDNWTAVSQKGYIAMQGGQVIQTVAGDLDDDAVTATHRYASTSAMGKSAYNPFNGQSFKPSGRI